MTDETTYYWLYNNNMTKFIRFAAYDINGMVDVREYKIQSHHTLEEAGCPIEPDFSADVDCGMRPDLAQEHWMELVRGGWRMVDDKIGRIKQEAGMGTCWVTLNSTRKVNS